MIRQLTTSVSFEQLGPDVNIAQDKWYLDIYFFFLISSQKHMLQLPIEIMVRQFW